MSDNVFQLDQLSFEALGDRVVIIEDEFRSGYECPHCNGAGEIGCDNCAAAGITSSGKKCSICEGSGRVRCPGCKGKGGLLVVAEESQRRPTSGVVVSVGPGKYEFGEFVPTQLKVGQSVLYSNFAGYVIDLKRAGKAIVLRILHESEILCRLEGHLTLANLTGKSDIALHNN